MRKNKTPLLIAAVAVMLLSATSAQAVYWESWTGYFATGYIHVYNKDYDFSMSGSSGRTVCKEGSTRDTFLNDSTDFVGYFVNTETMVPDTLKLTGATYLTHPKFFGWKYTGQSGTKEGEDGLWCAYARAGSNGTYTYFYIWGAWSTSGGDEYFNYNNTPPTWSGHWSVTGVQSPLEASGYGTVGGTRQNTWE